MAKQDKSLLIRGGQVVWPERIAAADLLIEAGCIQAILAPTVVDTIAAAPGVTTFDARGLLILPGLIDTHVHFNTGTAHLDTLPEAATGGALGGLTSFVGHVRSTDADIVGEIEQQRALVADGPLDASFHAIIDPFDNPDDVIPALAAQGVRSFKFFMAYRDEGIGMDDEKLLAAFRAVARVGGVALVHAEDDAVIHNLERGLVEAGRTAIVDYPSSRPPQTEVTAIERALQLAELAGNALYIVHTSTAAGLAAILTQRTRHLLGRRPPVYTESCPQYLLLNEQIYRDLGSLAKIAPPIRSETNRQQLFTALCAGVFDALGSDHSPHPLASKQFDDFTRVRAGAPGVQSVAPLLISALLRAPESAGPEPIRRLAWSMSERPAHIFGLAPAKGRIAVGADADLVFIDPTAQWEMTPEWLISNSTYSLFSGHTLQGRPLHTLVRGRWVLRDGALITHTGGQVIGLPQAVRAD